MESMLRNKKTILLFIAPAFIIFSVIVIVPVIYSVYYSFFKWNLVGSKTFIGITNFARLIQQDDIFKEATKNTFLLMGISLLIEIPFAILIALAISGKIKGKRYFKTVLFMPNILSSVAIGLMWTFIYNPDFGIINRFLNFIGLENMAKLWLSEEKTVLPSIIVVIVWQFIGYHMILFLAAIENIPSSLNEAAEIDGTNSWQKLRYITLPLLKPIIKIDAILIATGSLRFFDLIYVMSSGGPNHKSEVLASYMYIKSFRDMQYGYGSAISVILLVLCLFVTFILNATLKSEDIQY